jgi:Phage integrase family
MRSPLCCDCESGQWGSSVSLCRRTGTCSHMLRARVSRTRLSRCRDGARPGGRSPKAIYCPACGKLQDPADVCCNEHCKADISKVRSSTAGLRFHDLRHHAITELAEPQASDQTVMAIAGHVSPRMLAPYSHVRLDAAKIDEAFMLIISVSFSRELDCCYQWCCEFVGGYAWAAHTKPLVIRSRNQSWSTRLRSMSVGCSRMKRRTSFSWMR